tara:strand:- start:523 stop:1005 length:483 start_codon:yes stop_codon:yes gene_type:complete
MKKLILLSALLIFACSYGQKIVSKTYTKETKTRFGKTIKPKLISVDTINITQIKDEFISVGLGERYHYISTKNYKYIKLFSSDFKSSVKSKRNVYDGDKLIALDDEVDVLNFFHKYGFEFFKTMSYVRSSAIEKFFFGNDFTYESLSQSPTVLILRNSNN